MTVARLRMELTPREFSLWSEYLAWEDSRETKQDFYLAQIAAETRRSFVKEPRQIKVKDFLLKTEPAPAEKKGDSRHVWLAAVGMNSSKKKKGGKNGRTA